MFTELNVGLAQLFFVGLLAVEETVVDVIVDDDGGWESSSSATCHEQTKRGGCD